MTKEKIEIDKRIIQQYFVRECERQLVNSISNKEKAVGRKASELAQAGSKLEEEFFKDLLNTGFLIEPPN